MPISKWNIVYTYNYGDEEEEEEEDDDDDDDDDDLKPMEHGYVYLGKIMSYPWIEVFTGEMSFSLEKMGGTPNNGFSLTVSVKVSAEPVFGVLGDPWSTMVRIGGWSAKKTWWNYSHWFHGRWKLGTSRVGDPKNRSVRWWNAGTSTFPHWGRAMNAVALGIAAACGSEFWFGKDSTDVPCVMSKGTPEISLDISFQTSGLCFSGIAGLQEIHGFWFPILRIALPACWSHQMLWSLHSRYVPLLQTVLLPTTPSFPCTKRASVRPSVRPSISVHPSLYNCKDLHARQVTIIITVAIATYCNSFRKPTYFFP